MSEKFNVKRFSITLALVLLTAGAVGGTIWYFMNDTNEINKDTILLQQAQLDKLIKQDEEETELTTKYVADKTVGWEVYENEEYGFRIKFPNKDYKVFAEAYSFDTHYGVYLGAYTVVYIALPTNETDFGDAVPEGYASIFAIDIYNHNQWNVRKNEGPYVGLIEESNEYIYVSHTGFDPPPDVKAIEFDFNLIISTFELIK